MATETGPVVNAARRFTVWYILAAIAFIVLGLFAIIEPAVAGLGVAILVGWLLIFGGIFHFITAFQVRLQPLPRCYSAALPAAACQP